MGVERFLDRAKALRDGTAEGVNADDGRAAVALLATRKIMDTAREIELRAPIAKARLGARPEEVIPAPEMPAARRATAVAFVQWLNEWREVARIAINRRDYRISLGIAQRRTAEETPAGGNEPTQPAQ